ncbi:hypothetical protein C4D60_Mb09t22800 [Musa balbisiana]|uniref:Uncharacterized protein n=1 Tax=Musa balbisiana TaxID=52838 RepID=A0A4S8IJR0_MUSBA|nr:hypothetical protein C4D60_Mb09t22800 [Musa balbisiana]
MLIKEAGRSLNGALRPPLKSSTSSIGSTGLPLPANADGSSRSGDSSASGSPHRIRLDENTNDDDDDDENDGPALLTISRPLGSHESGKNPRRLKKAGDLARAAVAPRKEKTLAARETEEDPMPTPPKGDGHRLLQKLLRWWPYRHGDAVDASKSIRSAARLPSNPKEYERLSRNPRDTNRSSAASGDPAAEAISGPVSGFGRRIASPPRSGGGSMRRMSSRLGRIRAARMGTKAASWRSTAARQRGQVGCDRSHTSMQSMWKAWAHSGSVRRVSSSSNSNRHTAHSRFVAACCLALARENSDTGIALMAASSRP